MRSLQPAAGAAEGFLMTARLVVFSVGLLLALGCNRVGIERAEKAPDPSRTGAAVPGPSSELALQLALDERFYVDRREGLRTVMRLRGVPDVELWLTVGRDPWPGPMPAREELIAKARSFLEPIHGAVQVRSTEAGDTLLVFDGPKKDRNRTLYTVNWLLVRPAEGAVLRADLSLRMPDRWRDIPQLQQVAEHIGARLLQARFAPGA